MTIRLHRGDLPDLSRYTTSVAIDTETMGLNPHRDRLCVVQLSPGDGSADTVFRFLTAVVFNPTSNSGFPQQNPDATRRDVEQFLLAFDSDLAPITGQQVTLTSTNSAASAAILAVSATTIATRSPTCRTLPCARMG